MTQVANSRHGRPFAQYCCALPSRSHHCSIVGKRQPRAYARLMIDVFRSARRAAALFDELLHEVGNDDVGGASSEQRGASSIIAFSLLIPRSSFLHFLLDNLNPQIALERIVRVDG